MMTKYNQRTERKMLLYFSQLNEKKQRHYAAIEAERLGYGGKRYISNLFKISEYRIRCGICELNNSSLLAEIPANKQHRIGGGRKKRNQPSRNSPCIV